MQRGDLRSAAHVVEAAAWAEAVLDKLDGAVATRAPQETEVLADLVARFRLAPLERRPLNEED